MLIPELLSAIHDKDTGYRLGLESILKALDGSCETPIGGLAELSKGTLRLRGEVLRPDGSASIKEEGVAAISDGHLLGVDLAERILKQADSSFWKL